jgi:alpha-tubulin suppressor-like RCC1 family protein
MYTVSAVSGDSAALISATELLCVDLPTRGVRWRLPGTYRGSPGIADGRVFAIQGNAVRSYALADGSPDVIYQTDAPSSSLIDQPILFNDRLVISNEFKTWIFNLADGTLLQTLGAGGRLSYSNGYLLAAGNDGTLRAFIALNYNPKLASLELSSGDFLPAFNQQTTRYIATVPFDTDAVTITPTTEFPKATVKINGVPSPNGFASSPIALQVGENELHTVVTAEDGITTMTNTIAVTRLPQNFVFSSSSDIPVKANGFLTGGFPVNVVLNYHPVPGTALTMVKNTALGFIHGRFGNLAHGQRITLQYNGVEYDFVANYHGGSGNDLVLQWADTFAAAWGLNSHGQLGDGSTMNRAAPVTVALSEGVLAGKTMLAVSAGYLHSLALLHDGTLATWGLNTQGQLGLGHHDSSHHAQQVLNTGVLAGKTVITIAAGAYHNLALCSDGTIVSWGMNNHGQLGTGDLQMHNAPVVVDPLGALAGKRVVAVSAGFYHSLALCDDGTVAAWGYNDEGELGDGTTLSALAPVQVNVAGALAGKTVARIAAGQYHSLALCTDGTLVSWGYNGRGQLGDGTITDRHSPVAISLAADLTGIPIASLVAGGSHSLLHFEDGALAGWGDNVRGQLIAGGMSRILTPQSIPDSAIAIHAGALHSVALRDGELLQAWGDARGALAAADSDDLLANSRWICAASGPAAFHNLAILALPSQVGVPGPAPAIAEWRELHFGTIANDGQAADCNDCDHDGIPNLVEYAFGLDPQLADAERLPRPKHAGTRLELRFSRPPGVSGVSYGAESSDTLLPGSWKEIPDTGSGEECHFSVPVDGAPARFMRIKVKSP